jgi:predicted DNA-binding transcriptional regulator AlpA
MGYETTSIAANERIALRIRDASIISGLSRSTLYELLKTGRENRRTPPDPAQLAGGFVAGRRGMSLCRSNNATPGRLPCR